VKRPKFKDRVRRATRSKAQVVEIERVRASHLKGLHVEVPLGDRLEQGDFFPQQTESASSSSSCLYQLHDVFQLGRTVSSRVWWPWTTA
jgi:hypothetical protein